MKIKVKQSCILEGQQYGPDLRKKPGTFVVPVFYIVLEYFVALFLEKKIEILEISEEEIKEFEKEFKHNTKVEVHPEIISVVEGLLMKEEAKDETDTNSSNDGSNDSSGSEATQSENKEGEQKDAEGQSDVQTDAPASSEPKNASDELKKEYEALHEKAKRLNKTEKARYEELKTILEIKE